MEAEDSLDEEDFAELCRRKQSQEGQMDTPIPRDYRKEFKPMSKITQF